MAEMWQYHNDSWLYYDDKKCWLAAYLLLYSAKVVRVAMQDT